MASLFVTSFDEFLAAPAETVVTLATIYRLTWIDAALHDAPAGSLATTFERTRDFKHLPAAISWSRRRLFHGHVFGDAIEMTPIFRSQHGDKIEETIGDPVDITLPGFKRWQKTSSFGGWTGGYLTGALDKICKVDE